MSRKGDCWDNATAESFFETLKVELGSRFESRDDARRELFDYIEGFYNTWPQDPLAGLTDVLPVIHSYASKQ